MNTLLHHLSELFTPSRPRRGVALFWLAAAVPLLVVVFLVDPAASSWFPPCPFRALTGLQCPGCGSTRALHALLHGEAIHALRLNPLLAMWAPILGYALLSTSCLAVQDRPLPVLRLHPRVIHALLAVTVLWWVVRNTPLWRLG